MRSLLLLLSLLAAVALAREARDIDEALHHAEKAKHEAEEAIHNLKQPKTAFESVKDAVLHATELEPGAEHPSILGRMKDGLEQAAQAVHLKSAPTEPPSMAQRVKDGINTRTERVKDSLSAQTGRVKDSINAQTGRVKDAAAEVYDSVSSKVNTGRSAASDTLDATLKALHLRERSLLEKAANDFTALLHNFKSTFVHSEPSTKERISAAVADAESKVRSSIGQLMGAFDADSIATTTEEGRAAYEDMSQRSIETMLSVRQQLEQQGFTNIRMSDIIASIGSRSLGENIDAGVAGTGGMLSTGFQKLKDRLF